MSRLTPGQARWISPTRNGPVVRSIAASTCSVLAPRGARVSPTRASNSLYAVTRMYRTKFTNGHPREELTEKPAILVQAHGQRVAQSILRLVVLVEQTTH